MGSRVMYLCKGGREMEMEKRKVVIIPKIEKPALDEATGILKKKRVCAYARVSTDLEDQKNSFEAQKDEYTTRILKNSDWEFVKMYSDEGLSGTSVKKRKGFKEMIDDAIDDKIDLILTKSISRFARNTVDFLSIVRQLRQKGVEIFFEKEAISSLDDRCEMMLTMYASFAQEESHSISENVKWGVRKRMAKGTRKINAKHLLGYDLDSQGKLVINEKEAKPIRKIFNLYIGGKSYREICTEMENENVVTKTGKVRWTVNNIYSILSNEKYCGDVLQQKTYVRDFLSHEAFKNNGEVQQYLIVKNHEGIVSKETFAYAQNLKQYRRDNFDNRSSRTNIGPVANLIVCEDCLRVLKKITSHPGTPYAKKVLTCKAELKNRMGHKECSMKNTVPYDLTVMAVNEILKKFINKKDFKLLEKEIINAKAQTAFFEKKEAFKKDIAVKEAEVKDLVKKQIEGTLDSSVYVEKYKELQKEIVELKDRLEKAEADEFEKQELTVIKKKITEYLESSDELTPGIVGKFIFKGIRRYDNSIRFILKSHTTTDDWFDSNIEGILKMTPWLKGKVSKDGETLEYDVVRLEDFKC